MSAVRWTPRARRIGRAAQTIGGGLFLAAMIFSLPIVTAVIR